MARDDIHLVTFDEACKLRFGFEFDHARTQLGGHLMNLVFVQTEFLCDLLIRQVETQQVQTDDPFAQWLVMVGEDRVGQIIAVPLTGIAMIPLPFALPLMPPATFDVIRFTPDTSDTIRPAQLPDALLAFCIVYQIIDLEHSQSMLFSISLSKNQRADRNISSQI